jgi:hypothetical protein
MLLEPLLHCRNFGGPLNIRWVLADFEELRLQEGRLPSLGPAPGLAARSLGRHHVDDVGEDADRSFACLRVRGAPFDGRRDSRPERAGKGSGLASRSKGFLGSVMT